MPHELRSVIGHVEASTATVRTQEGSSLPRLWHEWVQILERVMNDIGAHIAVGLFLFQMEV